jgi:hypothetical protein
MSNRKEILISKYAELISNISSVGFTSEIFPSLEDIDIVDMLLLFNYYFASCQEEDYQEKIRELAQLQKVEITEEQFEKGIPIIINYINWLKLFQKQ